MTKTFLFAVAFAGLALVTGCSSGDGAIEVEAAKTPLTDGANDALFTVKLTDAPADGYPLTGLVVKAKPDGKDLVAVSCTPSDTNSNQKLDKDETIVCTEGASNLFGVDNAGKDLDVELHATIDGKDTLVGDATWTAAK